MTFINAATGTRVGLSFKAQIRYEREQLLRSLGSLVALSYEVSEIHIYATCRPFAQRLQLPPMNLLKAKELACV